MKRYPFLILTLALIFLLIGPFILLLKDKRLEIYPSISLPSGPFLMHNENEVIIFHSLDLFGQDGNAIKEIPKQKFLGEIPIQNFYPLMQSSFGLKHYKDEFKLYKPPIKFTIENHYNKESIEASKHWIRNRLKTLNFYDNILIIRTYRYKLDLKENNVISKELINEEIVRLH